MKNDPAPLAVANWDNPARSKIKTIAILTFGLYIAWNVCWLLGGRVPPSIFSYATGLPCPTSGMVRGLQALFRGEWQVFFLFNPFSPVYLSLLGISAAMILRQLARKKEITLPNFMSWAWLLSLALGWITKFAIGANYW